MCCCASARNVDPQRTSSAASLVEINSPTTCAPCARLETQTNNPGCRSKTYRCCMSINLMAATNKLENKRGTHRAAVGTATPPKEIWHAATARLEIKIGPPYPSASKPTGRRRKSLSERTPVRGVLTDLQLAPWKRRSLPPSIIHHPPSIAHHHGSSTIPWSRDPGSTVELDPGMVWYGMVWCGMVWYGMVW